MEVDVETVEKVAAFSDSDDSQDGLYFLPTIPLPDEHPEQPESPSHEQPATPPKPSSSSATETDAGSPTSDRGLNSRQMELNPTQSVDSPAGPFPAWDVRLTVISLALGRRIDWNSDRYTNGVLYISS